MADPESSIGDRPGRSGVSWLLVVFFLVFVAIVLVLGRGPDESRRRERVPPRPGSEPGKIDSSRLSGTSNVASPSVSLRRLVARGSVLDEITAAPVRGARVVLSLRAPLGKSRDPRATLVLSRGCLPASGPERETSKDGLDLPVLGVAESGEDGSFAISLAWPAEDLAALVWALRRDENRFSVSARFAAGSRHLAGHRAIEADRWTAEGVLDAGAIVVREPLGRLTVRVVSSGEPVPEAEVALVGESVDPDRGVALLTGKDGSVEHFPELPKLAITVRKPGFATEERLLLVPSPFPDTRVDVALLPEAAVSGSVADALGKPVPGALVLARELDARREECERTATSFARSDALGRFSLGGLRPGSRYALSARPRAEDRLVDARIEASAPSSDARFVLARPGRLRVEVRFPEGSRPSCLTLEALRRDESGAWTCAVRESETARTAVGRVELASLAPGIYRVRYSPYSCEGNDGDCAEAVSPAFEVREGDDRLALSLELTRARTISGRVLDTRGAPIKGAKVGPECCLHSARTAEDGRFELRAVSQQDVWLVASADGFEEARRLVTASEEALSPDIVLVPAPPPIPRPR